jgi:ribosome-associated protein
VQIIEAAQAKKAFELIVLDLQEIVTYTDVFIICSGNTTRQIQAICDNIEAALKKESKVRPLHIEGYREAEWILLDYSDIIVHVFVPEKRKFYNLEKLWIDAKSIPIAEG